MPSNTNGKLSLPLYDLLADKGVFFKFLRDDICGTKPTSAMNKIDSKFTELSNSVDNKVDKVVGKGLSTNDYSTTEKNKLSSLINYTHPNDASVRHVTDEQIANWNSKATESFVMAKILEAQFDDGTCSGEAEVQYNVDLDTYLKLGDTIINTDTAINKPSGFIGDLFKTAYINVSEYIDEGASLTYIQSLYALNPIFSIINLGYYFRGIEVDKNTGEILSITSWTIEGKIGLKDYIGSTTITPNTGLTTSTIIKSYIGVNDGLGSISFAVKNTDDTPFDANTTILITTYINSKFTPNTMVGETRKYLDCMLLSEEDFHSVVGHAVAYIDIASKKVYVEIPNVTNAKFIVMTEQSYRTVV